MLQNLKIRQRILLTFTLIVLTGSLLQLFIAGGQLQATTINFARQQLESDTLLVSTTLSETLEHYLEGEGSGNLLTALQNTGHEFLLLDASYRVLSASGSVADDVLPTLQQSRNAQASSMIFRDNSGTDALYATVAIYHESEVMGYLVLAEPMQPTYDAVTGQWLQLASANLPVLILVVVASLWIARSISRPVSELTQSALQMADGDLDTPITIQSRDEVGQLAQTLNFMAKQIDSLMKTQRSFVSNAAHELRTPLMTLKLRVEALQDERLSETDRNVYAVEIGQEIDHLTELVSSLLVLSRIDEGKPNAVPHVADVASLLQDISRHWRIAAKKRDLAFSSEITPDLPEIAISPNDLRLVLDNLLGNAVKYTPSGSVSLQATVTNTKLQLAIQDTGIGFTEKQAAQLFYRFYRTEQARVDFQGNGLGLSIIQALLEQYGGTIQAQSAGIGQGATFTVTLPLA